MPAPAAALAFGWRVGIELVGAIVIAVFLGWAIDKWLGTRPWGMVVMFFLGIATGMVNVCHAVTGVDRRGGVQTEGCRQLRDHGRAVGTTMRISRTDRSGVRTERDLRVWPNVRGTAWR